MVIIKFLSLIYLGMASINNFIETYKEYQREELDILVVIIMAILTILSTVAFIYVAIV